MFQNSLVSSFSLSFIIFAYNSTHVQQYTCTTVITNNIDDQEARPHQFHFANQLKCITRVKLRDFVLKAATLGPHFPFYERNAITRAGFTIWHSARASHSNGKTFFVFHLYLAERCCEIIQSTRGPVQCKSGPKITWLISVII